MEAAVRAIPNSIRTVGRRGRAPSLYLTLLLGRRGGGCAHLHKYYGPEQEEVRQCPRQVRKNVIYERAQFNQRSQREDKTAAQYITSLYSLAGDCEFGDTKDNMIRNRLVVGIRDIALSERLQTEPNLDLDKAKRMIRQREAVREQQTILKSTQDDRATVQVVTGSRQPRGQGQQQQRAKQPQKHRHHQLQSARGPCT